MHRVLAHLAVAQLEPGREQTVRAQVWGTREKQMGFRMRSSEATIGDSSGMMRCIWFNQRLRVLLLGFMGGRMWLRTSRSRALAWSGCAFSI